MPASRHLTIACIHCGRAAAEITLLPGRPGAEGQWADQDRLERTDFMGTIIRFGKYAELLCFFEAIAQADYPAARRFDQDFIAFICRTCEKPYCAACWKIGGPVFDEGFYDYTPGVCPAGHEQVIDD